MTTETITAEDRRLLDALRGSDTAKAFTAEKERERASLHADLAKELTNLEEARAKERKSDQAAVAEVQATEKDALDVSAKATVARQIEERRAYLNNFRHDRERQGLRRKLEVCADPRIEAFLVEVKGILSTISDGYAGYNSGSIHHVADSLTGHRHTDVYSNGPSIVRRKTAARAARDAAEELKFRKVKDLDAELLKLQESIPEVEFPTEPTGVIWG